MASKRGMTIKDLFTARTEDNKWQKLKLTQTRSIIDRPKSQKANN